MIKPIHFLVLLVGTHIIYETQASALTTNIQKATKALHKYERNSDPSEYPSLIKYLEFYKSWYQSVTPAPRNLRERLSPEALDYAKTLQAIVKKESTFQQKPFGLGGSKLSKAGENFYKKVLTMTKQELLS